MSNNYIYDDREFDWTNYWEEMSARVEKARAGKDDAPAPPGGDGGSGGGSPMGGASPSVHFNPPGPGYTNCVTWQEFWCSAIAVGSGGLYVTLSNTLPGVTYQLQETTDLANSSWVDVAEAAATNYTLEFGPISESSPNLFFRGVVVTNGQYPAIVQPPYNQVAAVGGSATFTVVATGVAPLSYQWEFNGTNIADATNSSYTVSNVTSGSFGSYSVVVSNIVCEADSAAAILSPAWTASLGAGFTASPAVGPDGTIYIANLNNQFFALNPVSGSVKWTGAVATPNDTSDLTSSAAVTSNDAAVYVGSKDGFLYAFNPANGAVLWSNQLGGSVFSSPAISAADGTIYVTTVNGGSSGLFAINPASQSTNWFFAADDTVTGIGAASDSSPAVGPECASYFLDSAGDLYAVDSGGNLKWFFPVPAGSSPDASPAIDADGN